MTEPFFTAAGFTATPLRADQVPLAQALFDRNPGYFQAVDGRSAHAHEAQLEFDVRVMFKPLAPAAEHQAEIDAYWQLVPRDRPDSALP